MLRYKSYNHSYGHNYKHLQLNTKYRKAVFSTSGMKKACEKAIRQVCNKHKIEIKVINIQSEHLHMIIDAPRTLSDSKLLQLIKGGSSFILFRAIPFLREVYPKRHLWSAGYFSCNVGADYDSLLSYIVNQNQHHTKVRRKYHDSTQRFS